MKVGDLVKMKYFGYWEISKSKTSPLGHLPHNDKVALVLGVHHGAIKVLFPNGSIKSDLSDKYEIIS